MVLYMARHGQTDYNAQGRYSGASDIPLNERGLEQAGELARRLADKPFDIIVSSPLLRARQTAEIVLAAYPVPLAISPHFYERNVGVFEGLTREEARKRHPDLWARDCTRAPDDAPTGGETLRELDERVARGLSALLDEYRDRRVLLICHGMVSRAIRRRILGLSFARMHEFSLDNCEIAEYLII